MAQGVHEKAGRVDGFHFWPIDHGHLAQLAHDGRPFSLNAWNDATLDLADDATHFGFVSEGCPTLTSRVGEFQLCGGMYFAQPGAATIGSAGQGIVISQQAYVGLFQIGGPIETRGRLQYIDGCSDTLLISPAVLGDACLNLLYLPPGTRQTAHTHPSFRAGMVVKGHGRCQTAAACVALRPGMVFSIDAHGTHSFHTEAEALTVIAFHPDSDFGPRHDDHPMVNRTIVQGVSAAKLTLAQRGVDRDLL